MDTSIKDALANWNPEDLANLNVLSGGKGTDPTVETIENNIKWLYHSKSRAKIQKHSKNIINRIYTKVKETKPSIIDEEDVVTAPSYSELVSGSSKKLKVYEEDSSLEELEIFISQAIIVSALNNMKPKERLEFFTREIDPISIFEHSDDTTNSIKGATTTAALIGATSASGFGVYAASTTALGFVTHAVGITLPFAAYTGLTSTIAFLIGPAGWLAIGTWGFFSVTKSEWNKLIPVILYITSVNSRKLLLSA